MTYAAALAQMALKGSVRRVDWPVGHCLLLGRLDLPDRTIEERLVLFDGKAMRAWLPSEADRKAVWERA